MSFSWQILGKDGEDLCKKYGINSQALGLGANSPESTESRHRVNDIREAFDRMPFKENYRPAAIAAVAAAQLLAKENLRDLRPAHCTTCTCPEEIPDGWSKKLIEDFLSLPLEEVYTASGGW